jgi:dCMP deaminase
VTATEYVEALAAEIAADRGITLSPEERILAEAWHSSGVPLELVIGELRTEVARTRSNAAKTGWSPRAFPLEAVAPAIQLALRDPSPPAPRRAGWDPYFMQIARVVASRATCDRKHVGALLVRDRIILSTGYNGSIRGMPHCDEAGHMLENGHCVATIHAEANAILQAARIGARIEGADIYTTASPCWPCFKLIANAGIGRIVYGEFYRDDRIFDVARQVGIALADLSGKGPQAREPAPGPGPVVNASLPEKQTA